MISYTKRFVNVVSLLITIVIYFFVTNVSINFCPQSIFNMFKKSVVQVELNSNSVNLNFDNGIEEKIEIQNDYPIHAVSALPGCDPGPGRGAHHPQCAVSGHPGPAALASAHRRRGPADPRAAGPSLPLGKSDPCRCRLWAFCSSALT